MAWIIEKDIKNKYFIVENEEFQKGEKLWFYLKSEL
jgi:hypothetical protein